MAEMPEYYNGGNLMKKTKIEKKIEENLKTILISGMETNDLWETYKKKASKKELKKFQKRICKKFGKKFEETFFDSDTFEV